MRSRRLLWLAFLATAALALVAVACGEEEKAAATPTRAAGAASPMQPAASPTTAPSVQTVEISAVPRIKFDKDTITVKAGGQVTLKFINEDTGVPHNWAAYTDSTASEPIPGAKTKICPGPCEEEITFTAPDQPGEYFFRCDPHPAVMTGTLVVQ